MDLKIEFRNKKNRKHSLLLIYSLALLAPPFPLSFGLACSTLLEAHPADGPTPLGLSSSPRIPLRNRPAQAACNDPASPRHAHLSTFLSPSMLGEHHRSVSSSSDHYCLPHADRAGLFTAATSDSTTATLSSLPCAPRLPAPKNSNR